VGEVLYGDMVAEAYDLHLYIWHGSWMSSQEFSSILDRVTKEYIFVLLSLNLHRHIIITFQHAYVKELRILCGDNIGDLISAHFLKTVEVIYTHEESQREGMMANFSGHSGVL
jgi:hypothetical protein